MQFSIRILCILFLSSILFSLHAFAASKAFNPDISANFLGLWQRGTAISDDRTKANHNGFSLQEAELQFLSDVDPYFRASMLLSIAQKDGTTDYGIDPEEVFLETISLPVVTLKAGKFKMALGKHNQLHTHAFPFIDAPLIHRALLGDEGLNEAGLSSAILLPTNWFSEFTLQGFTPGNDQLYNNSRSGSLAGLLHWKNLWDLNDDLTMEVGVSGTAGKNKFDKTSSVVGTDLTFKWRPAVGGKYHALIWSTEYLNGKEAENLGGIATWVQYQFAERWWLEGRTEYLGLPHSTSISAQNKQSTLLAFFPSEFSGIRMQYDHLITANKNKADHAIALQYNVTIGAHPAHAY